MKDFEVQIRCDSSQVDETLRKVDLLIQKVNQANELGILLAGTLAASIVPEGLPRIAPRGFLGLGWLKRLWHR